MARFHGVLVSLAIFGLALPMAHAAEGTAGDEPAASPDGIAQADDDLPEVAPVSPTGEQGSRSFQEYAQDNPATSMPEGSDQPWRELRDMELGEADPTGPHIEWHGYFRFRWDNFWNMDLDTFGTSPWLMPIEALVNEGQGALGTIPDSVEDGDLDDYFDNDAERLSSANVRLRLNPIFHVTEDARFKLELSILDNIVMGSTPDGFNRAPGSVPTNRFDTPLIAFTGTSESPTLANSLRNAVSVTQAYGEVNMFFGSIRAGRMASHWGLGILANGGGSYSSLNEAPRLSRRTVSLSGHSCLDCDFGDYVDRLMFITRLPSLPYLVLTVDWPFSGPTSVDTDNQFGQPYDLGRADNVRQFVVSVFDRPLREPEIAARNRTLKELRAPAFDYGLYVVFRRQNISPEAFNPDAELEELQFFPRGARAIIPDLWLRLQYEPSFRQRLRLELEAVAIFGEIENVQQGADLDSRTVRQMAAAMELDYKSGDLATGLNAGFASGRDSGDDATPGFGILDRNIPAADEKTITGFKFDRNYFIDMIMFREIIGGITNAYYANPFVMYDFYTKQNDAWGARFDLIYGHAVDAATTPSGEAWLGIETDFTLYYREPNYGADIAYGLFVPGSAFDAVEGRPRLTNAEDIYELSTNFESDRDASIAHTLQARFFWAF